MPTTYHGTTIPAGGDLAYGPTAFSGAVDKGNFVCIFATIAERDAWAAPPEGVLCYVVATKILYERVAGAWTPVAGTLPTFATPAERDSQWPTPPDGALAVTTDTGTLWLRRAGAWGGLRFASVDVTGALTVGATVAVTGAITAAALTASGRVQAGDAVLTTGALNLPGGQAISGGAGITLALASGAIAALTGQTLGIVTNGGNNWNDRPLYVQAPLGGIGFHSTSLSNAGSIQLFTSAQTVAGFHFVNGGNSGYFTCHAADFIKVSSRRSKVNIKAWRGDGVSVCQQLNPVSFQSKNDHAKSGAPRLGFIAEDVAPVVPEAVENDADGQPMGLSYDGLIPILVDAIRRLDDRLAALEAAA